MTDWAYYSSSFPGQWLTILFHLGIFWGGTNTLLSCCLLLVTPGSPCPVSFYLTHTRTPWESPSKLKTHFPKKSSLKRFYKHNKPQRALVMVNMQCLPAAIKIHQCVLKKFASTTEYLFCPRFVFCGFCALSHVSFICFTRKGRAWRLSKNMFLVSTSRDSSSERQPLHNGRGPSGPPKTRRKGGCKRRGCAFSLPLVLFVIN